MSVPAAVFMPLLLPPLSSADSDFLIISTKSSRVSILHALLPIVPTLAPSWVRPAITVSYRLNSSG
jgi:hypothetical protein